VNFYPARREKENQTASFSGSRRGSVGASSKGTYKAAVGGHNRSNESGCPFGEKSLNSIASKKTSVAGSKLQSGGKMSKGPKGGYKTIERKMPEAIMVMESIEDGQMTAELERDTSQNKVN
jgi:hypothetical protein